MLNLDDIVSNKKKSSSDTDAEKYQYLINKREQAGIKNLNDPHAFIEYSNDMNDVLENIKNYNKNRDKNY